MQDFTKEIFLICAVVGCFYSLCGGEIGPAPNDGCPAAKDDSLDKSAFLDNTKQCIRQYFSLNVQVDLNKALMTDGMGEFMKTNCPKFEKVVDCVKPKETDKCVSMGEQVARKWIMGLLKEVVEYLCLDDGRRVLEFLSNNGLQCLQQYGQRLSSCDPKMMMNMTLSTAVCNKVTSGVNCLLDVFKNCESAVQDFIRNFINALLEHTPCWGVIGEVQPLGFEHFFFSGLIPRHVPSKDRKCPGGETVFNHTVRALNDAGVCFNKHIDYTLIKEDASYVASQRSTEMMKFIRKYCTKLNETTVCVDNYLDSFTPCVDSQDVITMNATKYVVKKLIDFVCYDDGSRIVSFMVEDGVTCLKDHIWNIHSCLKAKGTLDTFAGGDRKNTDNMMFYIRNFWFPQRYSPEECRALASLEVCIYDNMKSCSSRKPANLTSSLIKELGKQTPCAQVTASSAVSLSTLPFSIALELGMLIIVTYYRSFN